MFIDRPAAEIEPSWAIRSSRATLPGPSRPSWSKSIRMLRCGIASLLAALERDTLDHGIDRPACLQGQPLHGLLGKASHHLRAIAIHEDIRLGTSGRHLEDSAHQHVECADLLRLP